MRASHPSSLHWRGGRKRDLAWCAMSRKSSEAELVESLKQEIYDRWEASVLRKHQFSVLSFDGSAKSHSPPSLFEAKKKPQRVYSTSSLRQFPGDFMSDVGSVDALKSSSSMSTIHSHGRALRKAGSSAGSPASRKARKSRSPAMPHASPATSSTTVSPRSAGTLRAVDSPQDISNA